MAAPSTPAPKPASKRLSGRAVTIIAGLVVAGIAVFFIPTTGGSHAPAAGSAAGPVQSALPPACPDFAWGTHHTCVFGDVTRWAYTGTDGGALCVDRGPAEGDYISINADGSVLQGTQPSVQSFKGFKAPKGMQRAVSYWKAKTPDDCKRT